ncbi:alpha/beta hydrolase [Flavobacterium terrigena]|uniref:Predicted hydrolase of the alpha/beta superfamily n=1 Tax=Flavobacterium terrigena TaxID=402734 RepID=A0A1H6RKV9_9FLAO|nr:alpha/beta hydrolase-fold protein [Flavobacterium terrigena]SEI56448.1 Predicted hydrolase of the alpha/beta superfamily [Flavobacterium terrigena]
MIRFLSLLLPLFLFSVNQIEAQNRYSTFEIDAPQLQTKKKIWVYLPLNYEKSTKKYPVIYMHDAQNLFDTIASFGGEWKIDETLDSLKAKVIVIGIEHGNEKRFGELTPYKNEKRGGGNADAYLEFIVKTLKPQIDLTYRTKTNARNTCIWGSSLGGLVSFYAALKYPDVFGKVGCFSPAFWINKEEIFQKMENTPNFNTKIYLLCGDNEGKEDMVTNMEQMETLINSKRCECKKLNKSVIVKGGEHNEKLWRNAFAKAYLWLF